MIEVLRLHAMMPICSQKKKQKLAQMYDSTIGRIMTNCILNVYKHLPSLTTLSPSVSRFSVECIDHRIIFASV